MHKLSNFQGLLDNLVEFDSNMYLQYSTSLIKRKLNNLKSFWNHFSLLAPFLDKQYLKYKGSLIISKTIELKKDISLKLQFATKKYVNMTYSFLVEKFIAFEKFK